MTCKPFSPFKRPRVHFKDVFGHENAVSEKTKIVLIIVYKVKFYLVWFRTLLKAE
jgi:hypothetical protein